MAGGRGKEGCGCLALCLCRSSRERSLFPKKDMASEKAMIENWTPEELADGQTRELTGGGGGDIIDVFEEPKNILEQVRV